MTHATLDDDSLAAAFDRLLSERCTPTVVRAIERADGRGAAADALWGDLQASGFLDALVPEHAGGAGLGLGDAGALLQLCGRHALPLPFGETLFARAALAGAGRPLPGAPLQWSDLEALCGAPQAQAARCAAAVAQIAGAAQRVLELSLAHAQQRVQFGKPVAAFQAVQHLLSVMAEQACAARVAAQMAFASPGPWPDVTQSAVAKVVAGEAAAQVAAGGHAVHGAMGITAECDLQLYTRRLKRWRVDGGSPSQAALRVGAAWWRDGPDRGTDFALALPGA